MIWFPQQINYEYERDLRDTLNALWGIYLDYDLNTSTIKNNPQLSQEKLKTCKDI